jgi:hypothetical protein
MLGLMSTRASGVATLALDSAACVGATAVALALGLALALALALGLAACGSAAASADAGVADAGSVDSARPLPLGLLQFHVEHNLETNACVSHGDCSLHFEDETTTATWLAELRRGSSLAILHWDRAIPWLTFDEDPPAGTSRSAFYDERLDSTLRGWLDAFVAHFAALPVGYVAVTPLNGMRDRLSPLRGPGAVETDVTTACPVIEPDTVVSFQDSGGQPASFVLRRAYRNLVLYLWEKLGPDYLALMVEANIFKQTCPAEWPGLVRFYRQIYDDVRGEVGVDPRLFVTLHHALLLGYTLEGCYGELAFDACGTAAEDHAYPAPDPTSCYPLDADVVADLDQGGRLDILALSFYPDGLTQAPGTGPAQDRILKVYPLDWDGAADCLMQAVLPPVVDPFAALDRLGWTKPVAISESSARSCPTLSILDTGTSQVVLQLPASLSTQASWLDSMLADAADRRFEFFVQSFRRDYPPVGLWTVRAGVLTPTLFSVVNAWPCSGITDVDGAAKPGVTSRWLGALDGGAAP